MSIEIANHPPHGTGETASVYEALRQPEMTREQALELVLDAAWHWADELETEIAPASEMFDDQESADGQRGEARDIYRAIKLLSKED